MSEPKPNGRPSSAGVTDVGRQRRHNEDHILVKPELRLFVVADGMGGHNAGDIASRLTTTSLKNFFEATIVESIPDELLDDTAPQAAGARRLIAGIQKANRDVFVISNTHQQHHGMGSTVVAAHLDETSVIHIAHVGDSRCYRVRGGHLAQITRDHSLINDAIDMKPDLTEDEIARLPKNIITRALGMKEEVKVDLFSEPVELGDLYLLCSDGLSGMVPDEHILEIISLTSEPQEACELLIAEANDAGGVDNISALVVRIDPEPVEPFVPEVSVDALDTGVDAAVSPGVREALERGAEVDLELAGPWSDREPGERRECPSCQHPLYSGNTFCVECGTRLSEY